MCLRKNVTLSKLNRGKNHFFSTVQHSSTEKYVQLHKQAVEKFELNYSVKPGLCFEQSALGVYENNYMLTFLFIVIHFFMH